MSKLLLKELKLAMHPTAPLFLLLSALLLIPNYPYYITFFYTSMAIFFTCLTGRENNDISFSLQLPTVKSSVVQSRFLLVVLLELTQLLLAIPFAFIRQQMPVPQNITGIEANVAFFGFSFIMLGLFNLVFFEIYYRNVNKVGKAFNISCTVVFLYMLVVEGAVHVWPFMAEHLDTLDPLFLTEKLIVLAGGIVLYVILTLIAYRRAKVHFEQLDL